MAAGVVGLEFVGNAPVVTRAVIATNPFEDDGAVIASDLRAEVKSALLYCDVIEIVNVGRALLPTRDDGEITYILDTTDESVQQERQASLGHRLSWQPATSG